MSRASRFSLEVRECAMLMRGRCGLEASASACSREVGCCELMLYI